MSNLLVRTVSGIVFLAVMVAGILLCPQAFGILFVVVMYIAMREFLLITMGERWRLQQRLAVFAAALAFIAIIGIRLYGIDFRWAALTLVPFFALPVSAVLARSHEGLEDLALTYAAILYIGLPFCLAPFMVIAGDGSFNGMPLLNVFIMIWCSDTGAYCLGTMFGQKPGSRKLAPAISPKKSYWGLWGGIVVAVLGAWVLNLLGWMTYPLWHCLALGVIVSVAGVFGDLFESLWKRRYGVKDSGKAIPGHGGMLDRFDSSLFAIPAVFVYLLIFGLL